MQIDVDDPSIFLNTKTWLHTSSRGTRGRGIDAIADLLLLEYNGRQTVIPRPQGYQNLRNSLHRYLPDIPDDHDDFALETNELAISAGKWVVISQDAFEIVVPLVQTLKVSSWARNRSDRQGTASQRSHEDTDPFDVNVSKTQTGQTFSISCVHSDTVANLKAKVQNTEGIPPDQQRLIYCGLTMDDDYSTLDDYGVTRGATIHLILRLVGGKPVIYLFPPTATRVSTKLSLVPEWDFSAIYPAVPAKSTPQGQELKCVVDASPDGTLKEVNTGLEVSYLYWEAETNTQNLLSPPASPLLGAAETSTEIFVPNRATLNTTNSVLLEVEKITPYLDSSLKALGLHVEARTSFITYWLPSINKHKHIALRFLPQSAYERAAPLQVEPAPDVVARIFMLFRGVDEGDLALWDEASERKNDPVDFWKDVVGVEADRLQDASVFRVVEWGGMEVR